MTAQSGLVVLTREMAQTLREEINGGATYENDIQEVTYEQEIRQLRPADEVTELK